MIFIIFLGRILDYDVSLVLTLHNEGPFLMRTLLSLQEAAVYAQRFGITVELLAVLDRADAATEEVLSGFPDVGFAAVRSIRVDNGSLGLSRNDGIAAARGQYLAMSDGDDLISCNAITEMYLQATRSGPDCLIFPEYLFAFGDRHHIARFFPLDCVTPLSFVAAHPFVSRVFIHRSVLQALPFVDARLSPGYAYEDWHFNAECVAAGCNIEIARDTILFYRQRSGSLLRKADALSVRQIPPTRLFQPEIFLRRARQSYERYERIPSGGNPSFLPNPTVLDRPVIRTLVRAANAIDPEVDIAALRGGDYFTNLSDDTLPIGRAYYDACLHVGNGPFDEVFLLPFLATGGGDLFLSQVMHTLAAFEPGKRLLVILGEPNESPSLPNPVPPGATVLDLGNSPPDISTEARELITLKLVEAVAPQARLHLRDSLFATGFFRRFSTVLHTHKSIFYRFSDGLRITDNDIMWSPGGFAFVSDHVSDLAAIITDNEGLKARDQARIGLFPEKFHTLPAIREPLVTRMDIAKYATRPGKRILWASRLDPEKRPDLLPPIARHLARTRPDASIEIFGQSVMGHYDTSVYDGIPNLAYCGPYAGFEQIDYSRYDVFLYTSWFDGIPNVVLEAISAGLPVVAADVGAIGEIVVDNVSGLLVPLILDDEAAATAYATALVRLLSDPALRRRLATAALERLRERHSPEHHTARLRTILSVH